MNKLSTLLVFIFLCNCAPPIHKPAENNLSCVTPTCDQMFVAQKIKTESIINHRQILPSFENCLGVTARAKTKNAYSDVRKSLSADGNVKDLSSPMMMAVTLIASELCDDLIAKEKSMTDRVFFPGFTITGGTNSQTFQGLSETVQTFANSCWGRSASSDEVAIIIKDLGSAKDNSAALLICTATLTSAGALKY